MYYQGTSDCAEQTEEEFPYLEFHKRPDRHRLAYDGREVRSGCGTVWFNRTRVTGREQFRFYMEHDCVFVVMGKGGILHGMSFEPGDLLDSRLEKACIADVCLLLGVSVRGGEIAFRAEFKETMRRYVTRTRLDRARSLLLKGWSVNCAALEVGWSHQGRFSGAFRKQFGVLPSSLTRPNRRSRGWQ